MRSQQPVTRDPNFTGGGGGGMLAIAQRTTNNTHAPLSSVHYEDKPSPCHPHHPQHSQQPKQKSDASHPNGVGVSYFNDSTSQIAFDSSHTGAHYGHNIPSNIYGITRYLDVSNSSSAKTALPLYLEEQPSSTHSIRTGAESSSSSSCSSSQQPPPLPRQTVSSTATATATATAAAAATTTTATAAATTTATTAAAAGTGAGATAASAITTTATPATHTKGGSSVSGSTGGGRRGIGRIGRSNSNSSFNSSNNNHNHSHNINNNNKANDRLGISDYLFLTRQTSFASFLTYDSFATVTSGLGGELSVYDIHSTSTSRIKPLYSDDEDEDEDEDEEEVNDEDCNKTKKASQTEHCILRAEDEGDDDAQAWISSVSSSASSGFYKTGDDEALVEDFLDHQQLLQPEGNEDGGESSISPPQRTQSLYSDDSSNNDNENGDNFDDETTLGDHTFSNSSINYEPCAPTASTGMRIVNRFPSEIYLLPRSLYLEPQEEEEEEEEEDDEDDESDDSHLRTAQSVAQVHWADDITTTNHDPEAPEALETLEATHDSQEEEEEDGREGDGDEVDHENEDGEVDRIEELPLHSTTQRITSQTSEVVEDEEDIFATLDTKNKGEEEEEADHTLATKTTLTNSTTTIETTDSACDSPVDWFEPGSHGCTPQSPCSTPCPGTGSITNTRTQPVVADNTKQGKINEDGNHTLDGMTSISRDTTTTANPRLCGDEGFETRARTLPSPPSPVSPDAPTPRCHNKKMYQHSNNRHHCHRPEPETAFFGPTARHHLICPLKNRMVTAVPTETQPGLMNRYRRPSQSQPVTPKAVEISSPVTTATVGGE